MPISINDAIAAELRAERARHRGMTVDDLAVASGVPVRTLNRYLTGERDIKVWALNGIAEALNVPVAELFRRATAAVEADAETEVPTAAQRRSSARKGREEGDVGGSA